MKLRKNLDDFMSIICFRAAIVGMEDILGADGTAAALIAAGRKRGKDVADSLGLTGSNPDVGKMTETLDEVFGKKGTKLCSILEMSETPEGGYLIKTEDTVCMASEAPGSTRRCTFTLGAVLGAVEAMTGKALAGTHVAKITDGSPTDDLLLNPY
ncbi:hydrocarbon-binding protein [Roseimicrobium sp. ORNL1]|uniref:hydrocarbon-binding protein n=1 Tax=Roseimicrobium sp. ORNL1 TaxID=2711231 RepID=UPI0013E1AC3D|nr:hydrocarbon-binding protein [Roseimicrobium sp. ORNL1]QIF04084.1 hydrocarbon-binding protein [Roseimicrobium sp. ORNL1]